MKNKKEELSEAIKEGIDNSIIGQVIQGIIFSLYIIVGMLILGSLIILGINHFSSNCEKEGNCQIQGVQERSCFPLENLECHVVIGNDTDDFWATGYFRICGFQEANEYFEQIKPRIEIDVKEDRVLYKRNSRIKYLECN